MQRLATWVRSAAKWIGWTETQPLILLTAACLLIGEQYPFSDFPMYSSFGRSTYYVYLADGSDQPLSTYAVIGVSTATFKKMYESALRAEMRKMRVSRKQLTQEQWRTFGTRFLEEMRGAPGATASGSQWPETMRLYEVQIQLTNGELKKESRLIAEQR